MNPAADQPPVDSSAGAPVPGACVAVIVHYHCPDELGACPAAFESTAPDVGVLVVESDPTDPSAAVAAVGGSGPVGGVS